MRNYCDLCADASRYGNALVRAGLQKGDRVLLFLDDGPAYPAALFGAIRAGFVPILINTLTPPDLLNFYLADSAAQRWLWSRPATPQLSTRQREKVPRWSNS